MTTLNTLPDKAHELLELALADLEKCEGDPTYKINMCNWWSVDKWDNRCAVCLAGSVIAQELAGSVIAQELDGTESRTYFLWPKDFPECQSKLQAINDFREGFIACGLMKLGILLQDDLPRYMPVQAYHLDKVRFKSDLRDVISKLKEYDV